MGMHSGSSGHSGGTNRLHGLKTLVMNSGMTHGVFVVCEATMGSSHNSLGHHHVQHEHTQADKLTWLRPACTSTPLLR